MKKSQLRQLIKEEILKENSPGFDTRKPGEALPTLDTVKAAYEAKQKVGGGNIIKEGIWSVGNPDDIKLFIFKIKELQEDYHGVVGSDDVFDGLDRALVGAEELYVMALDRHKG